MCTNYLPAPCLRMQEAGESSANDTNLAIVKLYPKRISCTMWANELEYHIIMSGYRIAAIMGPCQGSDWGPTPHTRTI